MPTPQEIAKKLVPPQQAVPGTFGAEGAAGAPGSTNVLGAPTASPLAQLAAFGPVSTSPTGFGLDSLLTQKIEGAAKKATGKAQDNMGFVGDFATMNFNPKTGLFKQVQEPGAYQGNFPSSAPLIPENFQNPSFGAPQISPLLSFPESLPSTDLDPDFASPKSLSQFISPSDPEDEALFKDLSTASISGLQKLLDPSDPQQKAIEEALFSRSKEDIERQAFDVRRDIEEGTFSRGVGLSTITGDLLDRLNKERFSAIERARREAFLGAGAERRAEAQSRLASLNAAFGARFTEFGRRQQARQLAMQTSFQNLLTRLEREQRAALQRESFKSAENIASNQLLAGGISAGLGGLAGIFGSTKKAIP